MTIHFVREMEHLHRDILSMCSTVEEMIHNAVDGLKLGPTFDTNYMFKVAKR